MDVWLLWNIENCRSSEGGVVHAHDLLGIYASQELASAAVEDYDNIARLLVIKKWSVITDDDTQ